jgi:hypothetical protein
MEGLRGLSMSRKNRQRKNVIYEVKFRYTADGCANRKAEEQEMSKREKE